MANNIYGAVVLLGGGTGALDAIDGAGLADEDIALVVDEDTGKSYVYALDSGSGAAESSPDIVSPDTNAGTKRWVLSTVKAPAIQALQGFRLTLETAVPVSVADQVDKSTIYFTPYKHNAIALYDGTSEWDILESAEVSLALSSLTDAKPYDVWAYNNAGTLALEVLVWTDDTNRATALTRQDGVLVKTGATTRRYVGTFYTTATDKTEDSETNRFLWNADNQTERSMFEEDTTNHTYSTATWREWRGVTNRLSFVVGLDTDIMPLVWGAQRSSVDNERVQVGLRLDGTTGADGFTGLPLATTETMAMFASNRMKITPGKHFIAATQWASAAGGMAGNWPNYKLFAVVSM